MLRAYCYGSIRSRDIVFDLFLDCGRTEESDQFLSFSRFLSSDLLFCVTLHQDTLSLPYLATLLKYGLHTGATQHCIIREKRNDDTVMGQPKWGGWHAFQRGKIR